MQRKSNEYDLSEFGPQSDTYDLSEFGPSDKNAKKPAKSNVLSGMPWYVKKALEVFPSINKPLSKAVPERMASVGAGLTHIGQGAKQLGLGTGEELGLIPRGSQEAYTKKTDLERKAFEESPAGRDPLGQMLTEQTESLPLMAALGPLGSKMSAARKILTGAAGGGVAGALQYAPQGESRPENIAKSAAIGGGIPLALEMPALTAKFGKKLGKVGKALTGSDIEKAQELLKKQEEEALLATAQHEQAKGYSQFETGIADADKMQQALAGKKQELRDLPGPEMNNLPVQSSIESENQLNNAREMHDSNLNEQRNIDRQMREHLNEHGAHDVHVASGLFQRADARRSEISNVYNQLENRFAQQHVMLNNNEAIANANSRLLELIKNNQTHTPEARQLVEDLGRLEAAPASIPANEYLTMIRSAKDYARIARRNAFKPDMNAAERAEWQQRYNALDNQIEQMEDIFADTVGGEDADLLREANHAWRTEVKPLQRNKTYQTIRRKGRIEGNIMNKLRGTDPGDVIMRNIIQNDPELLRNTVGQQFARNPSDLVNANEVQREYINRMPELQQMVNQHVANQEAVNQSENALRQAGERHQAVLSHEARAHKEVEKVSKKLEEHKEKVIKINKEIELLDKHIENLEKATKRKDFSLEQKVKAEKELRDAVKQRKRLRNALIGLAGGYLSINKILHFGELLREGE